MEEKTAGSVSQLNKELKLMGFKIFRIEEDSKATRTAIEHSLRLAIGLVITSQNC